VVVLSRIFLWYAADFGTNTSARLQFLAPLLYEAEDREFLLREGYRCTVRYMDYDWRLNR
jgi:hypothetical protein